jgi:hypothetical protein
MFAPESWIVYRAFSSPFKNRPAKGLPDGSAALLVMHGKLAASPAPFLEKSLGALTAKIASEVIKIRAQPP